MIAVIGLGANLGDCEATLRSAVSQLTRIGAVTAVSPVYETDPIGGPEQPTYLNAIALVDTSMDPLEVLRACQAIESEHGRTREVRWGARTLDLDVVAMGTLTMTEPDLTLPHPLAHERGFVLAPWNDVDPHALVPGRGTVAALLELVGTEGIERTAIDLR